MNKVEYSPRSLTGLYNEYIHVYFYILTYFTLIQSNAIIMIWNKMKTRHLYPVDIFCFSCHACSVTALGTAVRYVLSSTELQSKTGLCFAHSCHCAWSAWTSLKNKTNLNTIFYLVLSNLQSKAGIPRSNVTQYAARQKTKIKIQRSCNSKFGKDINDHEYRYAASRELCLCYVTSWEYHTARYQKLTVFVIYLPRPSNA